MESELQQRPTTGLAIQVRAATGRGPTSLAAFDDALSVAGVANFNLVRLSSIIPPGSDVAAVSVETGEGELEAWSTERPRRARSHPPAVVDLRAAGRRGVGAAGWGDRLYAVWAFASAELLAQEAWAGVAWVQDPSDGRGLFVEHEGGSEAQVREELRASLHAIAASRGMDHLEHHSVVTGTRCEGEPVGALVIAPYQVERWSGQAYAAW